MKHIFFSLLLISSLFFCKNVKNNVNTKHNQEIINFYCDNITETDIKKNRLEDKLFSDIIRNRTKIEDYKGDICFTGYPHYKNFKQNGMGGSKVDLPCYKNATVISNLKKENMFKFFDDCFKKDHGKLFKLIKIKDRLTMAEDLLNKYRTAEQVITRRLHCILPCRAFNTDSIFIHENYKNDRRFKGLEKVINGDTKKHNNIHGNRKEINKIRKNFLFIDI